MKKAMLFILTIIPIITFSFAPTDIELAKYHLGRGSTLYVVYDDYKGAFEEYTLAIKYDPKYAAAYRCRGEARIKLGQKDEACKDFKKSKELGDEYAQDDIDKYCIDNHIPTE